MVSKRLSFLDSDDAFVADLGHRLGEIANFLIAVSGDGADLGDLVVRNGRLLGGSS